MEKMIEPLKPLKTWSHLAGQRRKPSEYEIVSTNLHYTTDRPDQPFELDSNVPIAQWYKKYRTGSPIQSDNWDAFRDPDEMVYRTYNITQDGQESFVTKLFDQMSARGHDEMLSPTWLGSLARFYTPSRYLIHALQMMSGYIVQIAPASTISNCAAYQSGDHLRWLNHVAYRTRELANNYEDIGFAKDEGDYWVNDPVWQGWRKLIEEAMITWDWAESFTVLNLVLKPAMEEGILGVLRSLGRSQGDTLLGLLIDSELSDAARHRRWAGAMCKFMIEAKPENKAILLEWIAKWTPAAHSAIDAYCSTLDDDLYASDAKEGLTSFHHSIGLAINS